MMSLILPTAPPPPRARPPAKSFYKLEFDQTDQLKSTKNVGQIS